MVRAAGNRDGGAAVGSRQSFAVVLNAELTHAAPQKGCSIGKCPWRWRAIVNLNKPRRRPARLLVRFGKEHRFIGDALPLFWRLGKKP